MATATETDMEILTTDVTLGLRIQEAYEKYISTTVFSEAITEATVIVHEARVAFGRQVLQNPDNWKRQFVAMVCANQIVANDATAGGTLVGMTTQQVATAAAAIPDSDVDNAIAAGYNGLAGIG